MKARAAEKQISESEGEEEQEMFFYQTYDTRIISDNELTKQMQQERQEMLKKEKRRREQDRKMREASEQRLEDQRKIMKARQMEAQDRRNHQGIKREEELDLIENLEGNLGLMVESLRVDDTPLEMSFTGTNFTNTEKRIIFKALEYNNSVTVSYKFDPRTLSSTEKRWTTIPVKNSLGPSASTTVSRN